MYIENILCNIVIEYMNTPPISLTYKVLLNPYFDGFNELVHLPFFRIVQYHIWE